MRPGQAGGAGASAGIRFEQQLGALLSLLMLRERPFDGRLELGDARPLWLRFETEAPVDDLLAATSAGGFVAIQAKTTVNLSPDPTGGFAKTIEQFVRHWLSCQAGAGENEWDRPLDPSVDRLVLAVGPTAPASVRVHLKAALRNRGQPGASPLTQDQLHALAVFDTCVEQIWPRVTIEPWDPQFPTQLGALVSIFQFDPDGPDAAVMESLAEGAVDPSQARSLVGALASLSGRMMAERGGWDLPLLRRAVADIGFELVGSRTYANDIRALQKHSLEVREALARYEAIERANAPGLRVERDCQTAVHEAAMAGSLLIVGEPGAGKSGVLNTLARALGEVGDVLELAVDRFSIETLEGLRTELRLEHDLLEVLEAWDGPKPGWLIIDALDATRGGKGEGAFRTLIERVMDLGGRWRVVASIRTFDLRMGVQFRDLFRGEPPKQDLSEPGFSRVRHIRVPPWSQQEFQRLLAQAPELAAVLSGSPQRLLDLAAVPFNTRLINDLILSGAVQESLRNVSNQVELLSLYWDYRISKLGSAADACLRRTVDCMVSARALRAPADVVADANPTAFDQLHSAGVLLRVDNDRFVQFRHHLLFDYAASRLLLSPDEIIAGRQVFPKGEAKGLMLAPALTFVLQEIWSEDGSRSRYWAAIAQIIADGAATRSSEALRVA